MLSSFQNNSVICDKSSKNANWFNKFDSPQNKSQNLYINATTFVKFLIPENKTSEEFQKLIDKYNPD